MIGILSSYLQTRIMISVFAEQLHHILGFNEKNAMEGGSEQVILILVSDFDPDMSTIEHV